MIEFLSSWAEQIVLAVIIATIIELILPNNKNKKYIQMVIGVYILFNIISPIINNKKELSFENFNVEKSITESKTTLNQSSMDKRLEQIYLQELEKNIKNKFEENGYTVKKCTIDAILDINKKNAGIHSITVKLIDTKQEDKISKIKSELAQEYEIEEDKINIIIK